jgi:hypothetical protein
MNTEMNALKQCRVQTIVELITVKLIESLRIDCSLIYLDKLSIILIYSYLLISQTVVKCSSKLRYDLFKLRS